MTCILYLHAFIGAIRPFGAPFARSASQLGNNSRHTASEKIAAMMPLQKILLLIFKTFFSEKGSCDNMLSNLIDSLAVAIYPVA